MVQALICEKCGAAIEAVKFGPMGISILLCGICWGLWWSYLSDPQLGVKAAIDFTKVFLVFLVDKINLKK